MNPETDPVLAHHRRDTKTAATVHVLLIAFVIVLWFLNFRLGFLERIEGVLLGALFR